MASIIKRNNNFCVVYSYKDANGTPKQKWETFTDLSDAKNRKKEVEYKESVGTFVVPQCKTLNDLLPEYVALYGKSKWALSTYQANTALIANYITPLIGSMKLQDITTRVIEGYYQRLLKYEAADPMCGKRKHQFVSPSTVRSVHKILRSAFEQAVKWELMEKNPCIYATLPKYTSKKRDIWTAETLFRALKVCDDPKLRLCINLSFSCSLRLGELLGLTWDCVDISPESIDAGRASIYMPERKPTRTADLDYFYGQSSELFSFYRIPKLLFQDSRFQLLSTDAKTLYGILLDRMSLSARNGWLDKAGRVFIIYTVQEVQDSLGCADKKATKLLRELEEYGLIERKRRGLGKPDLIYVKNFSSESSKTPYLNRDNDDSGTVQNTLQDPAKLRCNKTERNNTEVSDTDPIYSDENDWMRKRAQLEEYFSQSLEVELLLRLCPDDEDTIYQIVDLLVDTCATNRKTLRIAGDDKPAEVVRSRFMKLNADHIHFVLKCLAENSSPIRNMKQYLLASLYNAPTTMQLFYQNQTNHDLAMRR